MVCRDATIGKLDLSEYTYLNFPSFSQMVPEACRRNLRVMELAARVSSRGCQLAWQAACKKPSGIPFLWILYGDVADFDMMESRDEDAGTTLRPTCGDLVPGDEYRIAGAKRPAHSLRC